MNSALQEEVRWLKQADFHFELRQDGNPIGRMNIQYATKNQVADCVLGNQAFQIRRTGFWSSGIEIIDTASQETVLTAQPKKWYSNSLDVQFRGEQFALKVWNNPLAEWLLEKAGRRVLAYGLTADGEKPGVRITAADKQVDPLLHFLLWYLFYPVAQEAGGDGLPFYFYLAQ